MYVLFKGSDCGVFICRYAELISRDIKLSSSSFKESDMGFFRDLMIYEMATSKITS